MQITDRIHALRIPSFAANPLVAKAFESSFTAEKIENLFNEREIKK